MTEVLLDRRIRRTRQALQEAVLELLEETDLVNLTVQEITRRADINRATFYQHYRDREDLLEQTFDVLIAEISTECGPFAAGDEPLVPDVIPPSFVSTFRAIGRRSELFGQLLSLDGPNPFALRFRTYCEQLMLQAVQSQSRTHVSDDIPAVVRVRYAASAGLGMFELWISGGCIESPEQMAEWAWRLSAPVWFDGCP